MSSVMSEFERQKRLYCTPPHVTKALLKREFLPGSVWEPAAGKGHNGNLVPADEHQEILETETDLVAPTSSGNGTETPSRAALPATVQIAKPAPLADENRKASAGDWLSDGEDASKYFTAIIRGKEFVYCQLINGDLQKAIAFLKTHVRDKRAADGQVNVDTQSSADTAPHLKTPNENITYRIQWLNR
jgi:hypothetical protein